MTDDKPFRFGARESLSRKQYDWNMTGADREAINILREQVAAAITSQMLEKQICENHVDYRLDVYVATPEQYWAAVRQEALRLTMFQDAWADD